MAQKQVSSSLFNTKTFSNAMKQFKERSEITARLQNFDFKKSRAYKELEKRNLIDIRFDSLVILAIIIAQEIKLGVDRQAKRRKKVMFKHLSENLDVDKFNILCSSYIWWTLYDCI